MDLPINKTLILASQSPQRRKILKPFVSNLIVIPSLLDEKKIPLTIPYEYVKVLSQFKTKKIAKIYPYLWVLGADTIVTINGNIIGKPLNKTNSISTLKRLSGKTHKVYTGYTIECASKNAILTKTISTDVEFKKISDLEIEYYASTGESFDKSGGYAIQGIGSFLIKKINGSCSNVMGLPICEVLEDLNNMIRYYKNY